MFRPVHTPPSYKPFAVAGVVRPPGSDTSGLYIAGVWAEDEGAAEMVALATWSPLGEVCAIQVMPA